MVFGWDLIKNNVSGHKKSFGATAVGGLGAVAASSAALAAAGFGASGE